MSAMVKALDFFLTRPKLVRVLDFAFYFTAVLVVIVWMPNSWHQCAMIVLIVLLSFVSQLRGMARTT